MRQDERLRGSIYYGLSSFFKIAVKIARRIHSFNFQLEVVEGHDQAVRLAQEILPGLTVVSDPLNSRKAVDAVAEDPLKTYFRHTVSHDHWQVQTEGYSIRYEVINGNIIHGLTTGSLSETEILDHIKLRDEVVSDMKTRAGSFFFVVGFSKSQRVSPKARKIYLSSLLEFYQKYRFRMIIFYNVNPLMRAGINLSRPFVPFKAAVAGDLNQALEMLEKFFPAPPELEHGGDSSPNSCVRFISWDRALCSRTAHIFRGAELDKRGGELRGSGSVILRIPSPRSSRPSSC